METSEARRERAASVEGIQEVRLLREPAAAGWVWGCMGGWRVVIVILERIEV